MTRRPRPPVQPHQHGTITGYTHGCACDPCTAANTRAVAAYRRRRAMGAEAPTDYLPVQHTRLVLQHLRDRGYSDPQISRLTGLSSETVTRVRVPERGCKHVTRETAERVDDAWTLLDKVPPCDRLAERYVDPIAARHRVRALMTQGWSLVELDRHLGRSGLSNVLYAGRRITPRMNADVTALYDRLWATRGPSSSTAKRAAARGWATPLELDEDRLDDPTYVPRLHRDESIAERRDRRQERRQEVARLTALGHSISEIAEHLGMDTRQVVRDRAVVREAS